MNTLQIENIIAQLPETKKYFRGVHSSDNLPVLPPPYCFIANTAPSTDHVGEHWVGFWVDTNFVEFFDSYGRSPFNILFPNSFKSFVGNRECRYNSLVLEGIFSKTCGEFTIYFTSLRCLGLTFDKIVNSFSSNRIVNGNLVTNFVKWI